MAVSGGTRSLVLCRVYSTCQCQIVDNALATEVSRCLCVEVQGGVCCMDSWLVVSLLLTKQTTSLGSVYFLE